MTRESGVKLTAREIEVLEKAQLNDGVYELRTRPHWHDRDFDACQALEDKGLARWLPHDEQTDQCFPRRPSIGLTAEGREQPIPSAAEYKEQQHHAP